MTMLCLGFVHIVHGLLEREMLSAVYDCTIAYPDVTPHREVKRTMEYYFFLSIISWSEWIWDSK